VSNLLLEFIDLSAPVLQDEVKNKNVNMESRVLKFCSQR